MTRETVLKLVAEHRGRLQQLGVRRIGLFGSTSRDEATESSDLDFLVDFERKTFDAYMDVKELLEQVFGRKVDLVIVDAIKPRLRSSILREAVYAQGF
jgi:hypothetical protein